MQREQKGQDIATHRPPERKGKLWEVSSQSGRGNYTVDLEKPSCTCPDFALRGLKCKHIYAALYTITPEASASNITPRVSKTERVTYRQDWAAYNVAQTNEKASFQALLFDLCQGIAQPPQWMGRPRLSFRDAAFSAAFKVYALVSTRRFMTDLGEAQAKGYLSTVPHYNSLLKYFNQPDLSLILRDLIGESSRCLKAVEVDFAVDASGFSTSRPLRWYNARYGHDQENHEWMKLHLMCGVKTNIVTSVGITGGFAHDSPQFRSLVTATARHFRLGDVPADKAYSSKGNLELVAKQGGTPYVPFKKNTVGEGDGSTLWEKLWHVYQYHREDFLAHYHKRSNAESTMWMIKSKFGEHIRSKNETAMVNELLCKVLCHNICVVIQSMYELGVEPTFWAETPFAHKVLLSGDFVGKASVTPLSTVSQPSIFVKQMESQIKTAFIEKDWVAVIRKADLLIKQRPDATTSETYHLQGLALLEEREMARANDAVESALALVNDKAQRLALLDEWVLHLASLDEWTRMLQYVNEALLLVPDDINWLVRQAHALLHLGRNEEAQAIYKYTNTLSIKDQNADHTYVVKIHITTQIPHPYITYLLAAQTADAGKARRDLPNNDSALILLPQHIYESKVDLSGVFAVIDGMPDKGRGDIAHTVTNIVANSIFSDCIKHDVLIGLSDQPTIALSTEPTIALTEYPSSEDPYDTLHRFSLKRRLQKALITAQAKFREHNRINEIQIDATLTGFTVAGNDAYIFNLGDCRTYILRDGFLRRITKDHSVVEDLLERKAITPDEVYTHPKRNQVYRSLGHHPRDVEVDIFQETLQPLDILISCSDGLWEMVRNPQMLDILSKAPDPQTACKQLIDAANANGGEDNIGVIVVFVR